ncbi:hypothetical protein AWM75_04105 [Aerococcus urinaehominis]|uniref:Uncharacterized protein n=1 Tax=Aerococcus urinaehominis TaxID=128944 RepID=A0A0X8FL01_9LACT|nr:V-type ATPase subunit [Aerococcus urinaehominis]AMB99239.1 hypothetical protein AWM75_04105 [Aerococcus urinaehominis]SDM31435.1 V/A-type H+-transporting ATPase subunit C [Aerococcus urinaehominis]
MSDTAYAGLNTTVRVYETKLLTQADYDTMLRAQDLENVLAVVAKTEYQIPDDILTSKAFDQFLMKNLSQAYADLYQQTPDKRVIDIYALRYMYHNLKVLFKEHYTEKDFSSMYLPIGSLSIDELRQAVSTGDSQLGLDPAMQAAISQVRTYVDEYQDYNGISVILDQAYLHHIYELAQEVGHPDLDRYVAMTIDTENLLMMARGLNQDQPRSFMYASLNGQGSFELDDLVDMYNIGDINRIISQFGLLNYGGPLNDLGNHIMVDDKINVVGLEEVVNEIRAEEMRLASLTAFGPMPVIAYLYFKENEIDNIRLILVGTDNGLDQEIIEERMRPIYGA